MQPIITTPQILSQLRIDPADDDRVANAEIALRAAEAWTVQYLGRNLELAEIEETVQAFGFPQLRLSRYPIVSVELVSMDGSEITDYDIRSESGILYRRKGWPESTYRYPRTLSRYHLANTEEATVEVQYTAGWVTPHQVEEDETLTRTLPYDLEQGILNVASTIYRHFGRDLRARRAHLLRSGAWYSTEEFRDTVQTFLGHYRNVV